mmetsp:Transcript_83715/g.161599  ORF Transcript_83715/g.161599 Transcript_83715/m.161599 type:complete len:415 (+) Transcript_83715:85-1329(+)
MSCPIHMMLFLVASVAACVVYVGEAAGLRKQSLMQWHLHLNLSTPSPSVHFIYTTGCDDYQLTHSVVFDYSWRAVGNVGRLTRITAGCNAPADRELMSKSPLHGDPRFAVFHATGELARIPATGEIYPARSRPHALEQWLRSAYPTETVVAMLDPDFVFFKPISEHPSLSLVKLGKMVSSSGWGAYGNDAGPEYATGPIWLLDPADLLMLIPEWKSFTDTYEKHGDGLMREQFSFQKSAAKHHVPAEFVNDLSTVVLCEPAGQKYHTMHYFSSLNYKEWGFHKALASSGWYADQFHNTVPPPCQCGAPLLQEPPRPPADQCNPQSLVALLPRMNEAFQSLRAIYCPGEAQAFQQQGRGAFGLVRTMHPISCPNQEGSRTRYRVDPKENASWTANQALGGSRCSPEAQMVVSGQV